MRAGGWEIKHKLKEGGVGKRELKNPALIKPAFYSIITRQ